MKTDNLKIVIDGREIIESVLKKHGPNPILSSTYTSVKNTLDSIRKNEK
jgi:hypothetical protein